MSPVFEYDHLTPGANNGGMGHRPRDERARSQRDREMPAQVGLQHGAVLGVVEQSAGVVEELPDGDALAVWNQPGQPPLDRVVERQPSLARELQNDRRDERLGHAADAKTIGHPHRRLRARPANPLASRTVPSPSRTSTTTPGAPAATSRSSAVRSLGTLLVRRSQGAAAAPAGAISAAAAARTVTKHAATLALRRDTRRAPATSSATVRPRS
jgi:hypothetical protein